MKTTQYLEDYYNQDRENERLLVQHGSVEFLTTMQYIEKYIKPGDIIMEIGAGTGRYSHALARQGYCVDAVELIEHNIEVFKKNTIPQEKITITQGNALDLSKYPNNIYDITLLLGPMYHLYTKEDKLQAIKEAIRVTKPGGVIFAAYCITDASILSYGFIKGHIFELIEKNLIDTDNFRALSTPVEVFELHRKEDIDNLMNNFKINRLHYVATDGYTNHMRDTVDNMDKKMFELYLKYHLTICERPDMLELTHHALDIFRKE